MYELDPLDKNNNGFINDDLIVWMREAAFPNFKKLYGVLYRANKPFINGLPAGNYSIDISYSILSLQSEMCFYGSFKCPIVCIVSLSAVKQLNKHIDKNYFRTIA